MTGGISASTMAMMAATAAVTVAATKSTAKAGAAPIMEMIKEPPRAQAAAVPEQQAARQNAANSGGYGPGSAAGTLLTGPAGVDPGGLSLGKNKLLGQ